MSDQKDMQKIAKAKGRPMLTWVGKKPLDKVEYFPAQEKEAYGDLSAEEFNKLFWGDNLQVLSHLLREYRGRVDLIYIDPPFDSKADYVRKVKVRGRKVEGEQQNLLEEKQYTDIWENDEYLQFLYERLQILRELLVDTGSIYLHCDWHKSHHIRCLLDEVFGADNFVNEIVWKRRGGSLSQSRQYGSATDTLLFYGKSSSYKFYPQMVKEGQEEYVEKRFKYTDDSGRRYRLSPIVSPSYSKNLVYEYKGYQPPANGWSVSRKKMEEWDKLGKLVFPKKKTMRIQRKQYFDEWEGSPIQSLWDDISPVNPQALERLDYPTQKPESLLERVIVSSSDEGDIVLDCFCGSGTTLAVAQKLGRRWIGCDINIGAIQTTTKRLSQILQDQQSSQPKLTDGDFKGLNAFKVYNVNNYDIFKNELEAKEIVMDVYGVEPVKQSYFDGILDNNFVKVLPLNRVLNKHDITLLLKNINDSLDAFTVKTTSSSGEHLYEQGVVIICSGVELDAEDFLKKQNGTGVPISIKNILRDKQNLVFKKKPEAEIKLSVSGKKLTVEIADFYSPILMRRLELENEKVIDKSTQAKVEDFHQIIDSVAIDIDYNGDLFNAEIMDLPDKKSVIAGKYEYEYDKKGKQKIAIKIVDVLGEEYFESFEVEVGV